MLSPEAAYEQAITPVEITHRAISNWSDTETAALAVAFKQAKDACAARSSVVYTGDALIGYARLCALGQQWPTVVGAATAYLHSADAEKPKMAQAYGYLVEGSLRMNDEHAALKNALDMLGAVPYTTLTDEVVGQALRYLQLAFTADALVLANVRERVCGEAAGGCGAVGSGRGGGRGCSGGCWGCERHGVRDKGRCGAGSHALRGWAVARRAPAVQRRDERGDGDGCGAGRGGCRQR